MNRRKWHGVGVNRSDVGKLAESFTADAIEDRGMMVLSRNFGARFGEIDLVAKARDTLVFVEVRARRSTAFVTPAETVQGTKSRRLVLACQQFLQDTDIRWSDWRIDVASVDLDEWGRPAAVEFIESAIEE